MNIVDELNNEFSKQKSLYKVGQQPVAELEKYKQIAMGYAEMENAVSVLSDMHTNVSYVYYGRFSQVFGWNRENGTEEKIDSIWEENARELFNTLGLSKNSGIIGISKRQEILINTKTLTQSTTLNYPFAKNHQIHLSHLAGTFSQPNPFINQKMLQYIIDCILLHPKKDLLELYCGSGNFTIALAPLFKKVFATEVVKTALSMVSQNAKQNHISNITCARLSGSESIEALSFKRDFFRLKNIDLKDFSFSHILVDPPRSGINDTEMLEFMGNFEYILYISCNVLSLKKDLAILSKTHKVIHSAIFDQFPHTTHLESAMILQKLRHLDE